MDEIQDPVPTSPQPSVWQKGATNPTPSWLERVISWVRGPVGPYVTAVVFALMALPVVLFDVEVYSKRYTTRQDAPLAPTDASALTASLLALILAAVIGSVVGVPIVRRHAKIGWLATALVAWITGIVALPLGPTIAGLPYAAARFCFFDGCQAQIAAPGLGFPGAAPYGLFVSPLFAPLTLVALAFGAGLWAWLVDQAARPAIDPPP